MFLINRPTPLPFESLEGYMDRLGSTNHYDEKGWFTVLVPTHIGPSNLNLLSNEQALLSLSQLTLLDVNSLVAMTLHRFVPYFCAADAIPKLPHLSERFSVPLWSRMIFASTHHGRSKICPLCWQEHRTHFLPWLLRPVTACVFHRAILIDVCPHCGTRLKPTARTCPFCESHIGDFQAVHLEDPLEIMYTETVWRSIGLENCPSGLPTLTLDGAGQVEITLPQFFEFLWKMGTLLAAYDRENPYLETVEFQVLDCSGTSLASLNVRDMHRVMLAAFQILSGWPESWYSTLDRAARLEDKRKSDGVKTPRAPFPARLKKFFTEPCWNWLLETFVGWMGENAIHNRNALPWLIYMGRQPYRDFASTSCVKSKSTLCREFGIDARIVDSAIQEGLVHPISMESAMGKRTTIKELLTSEDFEKIRDEMQSFMSLEQAAEYVGLPSPKHLIVLSKEGILLERKRILTAKKGVRRQYKKYELEIALDELIGHLPQQPIPLESPDALSLLAGLQVVAQSGIEMADLLAAVRDSSLKSFHDPQRQGLRGLWFYKKDIEDFRSAYLRNDWHTLYSASRVIRILRCGYKTLQFLFKAGVLVPIVGNLEVDEDTWQYDSRDVAIFQRKYVTGSQAAEIVDVTYTTLISWIRNGRLPTIVECKAHDSRRHIISREDVLRLKQEIEEERQAARYHFYSKAQIRKRLGISSRMVGALIESGWISPPERFWIGPKQYDWRFSRSEVEAALERLIGHLPSTALTDSPAENLISFVNIRWNINLKVGLIQSVERGEVSAYRDPTREGFRALLFHKKDVSAFERQFAISKE